MHTCQVQSSPAKAPRSSQAHQGWAQQDYQQVSPQPFHCKMKRHVLTGTVVATKKVLATGTVVAAGKAEALVQRLLDSGRQDVHSRPETLHWHLAHVPLPLHWQHFWPPARLLRRVLYNLECSRASRTWVSSLTSAILLSNSHGLSQLTNNTGNGKCTGTCGKDNCVEKHDRLLHQETVAPASSTVGAISQKSKEVLMKTVTVTLSGPKDSASCIAFSDEGSGITLVTTEIALKIGCTGRPQKLQIQTMYSITEHTAKMVSFEVQDRAFHRKNLRSTNFKMFMQSQRFPLGHRCLSRNKFSSVTLNANSARTVLLLWEKSHNSWLVSLSECDWMTG